MTEPIERSELKQTCVGPNCVEPAAGHDYNFGMFAAMNHAVAKDTGRQLVQDSRPGTPVPETPTSPENKGWDIVKRIKAGNTDIKFVFLTIGSRGDVQPFVSLCLRLMKLGYKTKICTFSEFENWVKSHGIEFAPVAGDPAKIMGTLSAGTSGVLSTKLSDVRAWIDDLMDSSYKAALDADVFCATHSSLCGPHIAEALDVPFFFVFTMPWTKTREFPQPFLVPNKDLGGTYNLGSFVSVEEGLSLGLWAQYNRFRKRISLPTEIVPVPYFDPIKIPTIYCFSEALIPHPKDWPEHIYEAGYFFLDNPDLKWTPPPGLEDFIARGGPRSAVYIGFGSIVVPDAAEMTRTVIAAVKKSSVNVILSKGWSARGDSKNNQDDEDWPENIYRLDSVPHDWLFPQLRAVVHHGGAGTLAAGLRAGCATCVKPWFGDQYFWGGRVQSMGAGFMLRDLTVDGLAAALTRLTTDDVLQAKAEAVGQVIRDEDGPGNAIQFMLDNLDLAQSSTDKLQRTLRQDLTQEVADVGLAIKAALETAKNAALSNESILSKTLVLGNQTVQSGVQWISNSPVKGIVNETRSNLTDVKTFIYNSASAVEEEAAKKIQHFWRWWKK